MKCNFRYQLLEVGSRVHMKIVNILRASSRTLGEMLERPAPVAMDRWLGGHHYCTYCRYVIITYYCQEEVYLPFSINFLVS